jgi:hypothetical protein
LVSASAALDTASVGSASRKSGRSSRAPAERALTNTAETAEDAEDADATGSGGWAIGSAARDVRVEVEMMRSPYPTHSLVVAPQ